jgi:PPOX class probable F420-dependent enzyme
MSPELRAAGRRRYVSLTSFRRSGAGVATAVWVAPAGESLVVVTGAGEGKTKRVRHDPRVELRECSVTGRVRPGAPVVHGVVEVVRDPLAQAPLLAALRRKYGWQLGAYLAIERRLRPDGPGNVILRITDA